MCMMFHVLQVWRFRESHAIEQEEKEDEEEKERRTRQADHYDVHRVSCIETDFRDLSVFQQLVNVS